MRHKDSTDLIGSLILFLFAVALVLYCAGQIVYGFGVQEGLRQNKESCLVSR